MLKQDIQSLLIHIRIGHIHTAIYLRAILLKGATGQLLLLVLDPAQLVLTQSLGTGCFCDDFDILGSIRGKGTSALQAAEPIQDSSQSLGAETGCLHSEGEVKILFRDKLDFRISAGFQNHMAEFLRALWPTEFSQRTPMVFKAALNSSSV